MNIVYKIGVLVLLAAGIISVYNRLHSPDPPDVPVGPNLISESSDDARYPIVFIRGRRVILRGGNEDSSAVGIVLNPHDSIRFDLSGRIDKTAPGYVAFVPQLKKHSLHTISLSEFLNKQGYSPSPRTETITQIGICLTTGSHMKLIGIFNFASD